MTESLENTLIRHEGLRLKPYDDIVKIAILMEGAWRLYTQKKEDDAAIDDDFYQEWIKHKKQLLEKGVRSDALQHLAGQFQLESWQTVLLLMVALPALEPKYQHLYGQLSPHSQPGASLDWLLPLLADSETQKQDWCRQLSGQNPLFSYRFLIETGSQEHRLSNSLTIGGDLLAWLLEQPFHPDQSHYCLNKVRAPEHELLPEESCSDDSSANETVTDHSPRLMQLTGAPGSGRQTLALQASQAGGQTLYEIDSNRFKSFEDQGTLLADLLRSVSLRKGMLYWPEGLTLLSSREGAGQKTSVGLLHDWLRRSENNRLWFGSEQQQDWPRNWLIFNPVNRSLSRPSESRSVALWQAMAGVLHRDTSEVDWQTLANRYRLLPGDMVQALMDLNPVEDGVSTRELLQACLARTPASLSGLATRITPRVSRSDLVLLPDASRQLDELIERHRLRQILCRRGISPVSGIMALFSGKPGTGKTLAAETLASDLALPLYKVNLANVASKWIGETEKHLDALFDEVEYYNGILFFDEADAVFARRSEANSSHDKNANMGVSYLLQRIESFNGLLVLATNFKGNLDRAFLRRMQFSIEFALPDLPARREIWKRWLALLPVDDRIDAETLASKLELSGAQIRNIAQSAMTLALSDNEQQPWVSGSHLKQAIRREFQKSDSSFLVGQKLSGLLPTEPETPNE